MIDPSNVPAVESAETVARFFFKRDFNQTTKHPKQDAFIPPPRDLDLSVTRHRDASIAEIWLIGRDVERQRSVKAAIEGRSPIVLVGCGNLLVSNYEQHGLNAIANAEPANPNHALILGWPENKEEQKKIALALASICDFQPIPATSPLNPPTLS